MIRRIGSAVAAVTTRCNRAVAGGMLTPILNHTPIFGKVSPVIHESLGRTIQGALDANEKIIGQ